VPIVYDIDDDYSLVPDDHPEIRAYMRAMRKHPFKGTLEMARAAAVMTVTTEPIAEHYRAEGVERVHVVPNALKPSAIGAPAKHDGFVIGWIGGDEHTPDVEAVGLVPALERLLERHRDVRVEAVGIDLGLSQRYHHHGLVHFDRLGRLIAKWDVGIAPLDDTAFNRARSAIKVQEYAARGVPWLASPVGPYAGLGEQQGGRLVEHGVWYEALDRLVRKRREHRRLAEAGSAWARTQTIGSTVERWEAALAEAVAVEASRRGALSP
jgi:glycosyltransferase involved in cell wall biosynthesis